MITNLHLVGFKAFAKAVIPLEPMTVIVGPNGSGKTSVLEALHCLAQLVRRDTKLDYLFSGPRVPDALRHRHSAPILSISADASMDGVRTSLAATLKFRSKEEHGYDFTLDCAAGEERVRVSSQDYSIPALPQAVSRLGSAEFLRLDARALAAPSYDLLCDSCVREGSCGGVTSLHSLPAA